MSKQTDEGGQMEREAQRLRLYEQFEIAKKLYAVHSLLPKTPPLNREKIIAFLDGAVAQFQAAGGVVQVGTNVLGEQGPILRCENGDVLRYEIGRELVDAYVSAGTFR
ncbi:hypothetical protein [Paraburkholderia sp. BCC1876]|uniref:hypothetical protein n=1 Tax=Paraburkholderia sp. BCC1876 TaxID=2676303 RepID=UPI00158FA63A|nr:hypothetical protein [Paraburkholderia sp. BCC1876]